MNIAADFDKCRFHARNKLPTCGQCCRLEIETRIEIIERAILLDVPKAARYSSLTPGLRADMIWVYRS